MSRPPLPFLRSLVCAASLGLLAGCATFGGHVKGQFACRAPQGSCAPTQVIDARAIGSPRTERADGLAANPHVRSVNAAPGDLARTSERKLRIVFPAHIDARGVYHEQAVAWSVVEPADWAARFRTAPVDRRTKVLNRIFGKGSEPQRDAGTATGQSLHDLELASQSSVRPELSEDHLLDENALSGTPSLSVEGFGLTQPDAGAARPTAQAQTFIPSDFDLASPPAQPTTAREAIAGAHAPGLEGFDTTLNRDRTPRPSPGQSTSTPSTDPLVWPSAAAIDAAHARTQSRATGAKTAKKGNQP